MIIYEVNLVVQDEIVEAYRSWLREHIQQMLLIDGFISAAVYGCEEVSVHGQNLTVQYRLRDREALDQYLQLHAARMRAEAEEHFAGKFTATRRVLNQLAAFGTRGRGEAD